MIAPFLILLRVAKRSALTSETTALGPLSTPRFRGDGELVGGDATISHRNPTNSMEVNGGIPTEGGIGAENTIEEVPL